MALPEKTTFEVRPGFGSSTNSGGFVPGGTGTDYSRQNASQFSGTDLVQAAFSVVSSLSHSFVSTDIGNIIRILAGTGFTVGFYQIVSVASGLATLDRDPGTGVGGTWVIGGALDTITTAVSLVPISSVIYLKGTYTVTAADVISLDSSFHNPFVINGYSVARDDGSMATWTTSTNSINLVDCSGLTNAIFKNIIFSNTAATKGTGKTAGNGFIPINANASAVIFANCIFDGFTLGFNLDWQNIAFTILNLQCDTCEFRNMVSHAIITTGQSALMGCFFHDNGGDGYRCGITASGSGGQNGTSVIAFSTFYTNGGNGITNESTVGLSSGAQSMLVIINSNFVSNVGSGVTSPTDETGSAVNWNNIFYGNGTYGWFGGGVAPALACIPRGNAYGANVTADRLNMPLGSSDITLTGNPFTNPSGHDFTLNNTAGAGAACKAAGYQSTIL